MSGSFSLPMAGPFPGPAPDVYPTSTITAPVGQVCSDVAAKVKPCPMSVVRDAYARACWDFTRQSMWLRRTLTPTLTLTINQNQYLLPTDPDLAVIGIAAAAVLQIPNGNWLPLDPAEVDAFDINQAPNLPRRHAYIPGGGIAFWPTPNAAFTIAVKVICEVQRASLKVPTDLLEKFRLFLESGALAHLYEMRGESWYDPAIANAEAAKFQGGVQIARAWVAKGNQTGSVRARPRVFIAR
jgi:hypothetical protein